jgi:hypothetical protein
MERIWLPWRSPRALRKQEKGLASLQGQGPLLEHRGGFEHGYVPGRPHCGAEEGVIPDVGLHHTGELLEEGEEQHDVQIARMGSQ